MNNRVNIIRAKDGIEGGAIADIKLVKINTAARDLLDPKQRLPVAIRQVINHYHIVTSG